MGRERDQPPSRPRINSPAQACGSQDPQPLRRLTRVMTPIRSRSWAALREVSLGVERPLSGGEALARDRAVREVGMEPRLRSWVRLRASMLPLVTRVSISSARSSVDSFSSWIILRVSTPDLAVIPDDQTGHAR